MRLGYNVLSKAFVFLFAIAGMTVAPLALRGETDLPVKKIMKKSYYVYSTEKGETMEGIARKYGWDISVLEQYNNDVILPIEKGTMLFYPVENKSVSKAEKESPITNSDKLPDNIEKVSGTEDNSVRRNDKEYFREVRYIVQHHESLYGIARKFNTTTTDLINLNPFLAQRRPENGEEIIIRREKVENQNNTVNNSNSSGTEESGNNKPEGKKIKTEPLLNPKFQPILMTQEEKDNEEPASPASESPVVGSATEYKVRRGENWTTISEKTGISEALLREMNPGKTKLKSGDMILLPVNQKSDAGATESEVPPLSEETPINIRNINEGLEIGTENEVSIAILLSEPESNKDMEFSRGALLAVDRMKDADYLTRLAIIDSTLPEENVLEALDSFSPGIIVTTSGKTITEKIMDYAGKNNVIVINSFDAKDDAYLTNPNLIQIQAPSKYFNDYVSEFFKNKFINSKVIVAGAIENGDTMGEKIVASLSDNSDDNIEEVHINDLTGLDLDSDSDYVIYATPSKKDDVKNLLEKIMVLRDRNILSNIKVIGRPNWITMVDSQKELFTLSGLYLPTRFYFDSEAEASRSYIEEYKELFGHTPLKSYPVYSVTSYDILTDLIPVIANRGDKNIEDLNFPGKGLQTSIELIKVDPESGFVNPDVFVVEFIPFSNPIKHLLKK